MDRCFFIFLDTPSHFAALSASPLSGGTRKLELAPKVRIAAQRSSSPLKGEVASRSDDGGVSHVILKEGLKNV